MRRCHRYLPDIPEKTEKSAAPGNGHYLTYGWKQSNISFKFVKVQDGD
jgi:hypothetical protein